MPTDAHGGVYVPAGSALAWREGDLGRRPADQGAPRSQAARACGRKSVTKTSSITSFRPLAHPSHCVGCHPSSQKCRQQMLTDPRMASMTSGHRRAMVPINVIGRAIEVRQIDDPPLGPRGQRHDNETGLGQDAALCLSGVPVESSIGPQPLRHGGSPLQERGGRHRLRIMPHLPWIDLSAFHSPSPCTVGRADDCISNRFSKSH